jgi:hypothetical protein
MRTSVVVPLALVLCACGSSMPPPVTPPPAPLTAASVTPPPAHEAPFDLALPAGAAITASIDLARIASPDVMKLVSQNGLDAVLSVLKVQPGQDLHATLASIGIDESRPVAFAQAGLGEDGHKAITALKAITLPSAPEQQRRPDEADIQGVADAMRTALADVSAVAVYRLLVPTRDATRLKATVASLLGLAGFKESAPGEYSSRHGLAVVHGDGDMVSVDLAVGERGQEALQSLRAMVAKGHVDAPVLAGAVWRVVYTPERVAEIGLLAGSVQTSTAISGGSIDPSQKNRIAHEGLKESNANLTLSTGSHGARWSRMEVSAGLDGGHVRFVVRAEPGPSFEGPPPDAWAPSFTVKSASPTAHQRFDVSRSFLDAWKVPGPSATALDLKAILRLARDAGWSGIPVALPDVAVSLARFIDRAGVTPSVPVLERLERFAVTRDALAGAKPDANTDVFLGVLPDGTTRSAAECVLSGTVPCVAHRVALGAVVKDGDQFARLAQVGTRYVLLRSNDRAGVAVKLLAGTAAPVQIEVPLSDMPDVVGGLAGTLVATVHREGTAVVIEAATQ